MLKIQRKSPSSKVVNSLDKINLDIAKSISRRSIPRLVKDGLIQLFHRKCAFCETVISESDYLDVLRFRPKRTYPWLAFTWENLYISCPACHRHKNSRFPIKGETANTPALLNQESPLLIDPCLDSPADHLIFDRHGLIHPKTERGKVTIATFGLDRLSLVKSREEYLKRIMHLIQGPLSIITVPGISNELREEQWLTFIQILREILSVTNNYVLMVQQTLLMLIKQFIDDSSINYKNFLLKLRSSLESFDLQISFESEEAKLVRPKVKEYNLEKKENLDDYYMKQRLIERVVICNFKTIDYLDLTFTNEENLKAPWLMLLGENGTGKSSILQAITLALMGEKHRKYYNNKINFKDLVKVGKEKGFIKIYLTGEKEPIELHFDKNSNKFGRSSKFQQPVLLLAYGSTRLLPRSNKSNFEKIGTLRVENLFNPYKSLLNASALLYNLKDSIFESVSKQIEAVISLDSNLNLVKGNNKDEILIGNYQTKKWIPLNSWSDGYQAVVALLVDIIMVIRSLWPDDSEEAEGIILLDEIDTHLHPRWKRRIITDLRNVFPRLQFIVTTHDPLCLQGLNQGEIIVLKKSSTGEIIGVNDLPPSQGLEVDQILTSEFFGLHNTISIEIDSLFEEYYSLISKTRSLAENDRLVKVEKALNKHELLGNTKRERLLFQAIDKLLINIDEDSLPNIENMEEETKDEMLNILKSLDYMEDNHD